MVFGVLCRMFLSVTDIKLLCDAFQWTRLIWGLHVWCFVVARVLVFWWSVFRFRTWFNYMEVKKLGIRGWSGYEIEAPHFQRVR